MDEWTRKVWAARQYGYSWKEIATPLGLTEHQVKLRFRYAIGKLRARLGGPRDRRVALGWFALIGRVKLGFSFVRRFQLEAGKF